MPALITEHVYNDRDNTVDLLLKADGVAQDLSAVTRMVVADKQGIFEIDSNLMPSAFDWDSETTGKVVLTLGHSDIASGTYVCRLIVYDLSNTEGIMWGELVLRFYD